MQKRNDIYNMGNDYPQYTVIYRKKIQNNELNSDNSSSNTENDGNQSNQSSNTINGNILNIANNNENIDHTNINVYGD